MKRKLITILTLCVVLCASIFCLTACNETPNAPAHSHVYNKKVTTETYLASDATCLQKAKYYFSCECGDVGSVTFEHGNYAPHVFENYTANNDAKCGVNGTETAACEQNGCNKTDTREIVGSALEHSWSAWSSNGNNTHTRTCLHNSAHTETKDCNGGTATCTEKAICVDCKESHGGFEKHNYIEQNTDSKYLKKEKECGAKAQYYYSCACGATGTNFFEHGTALGHEWSAWSSNGNNTHTRTCLHNSAHTETKDCNGGTATCTELATCKDCNEKYGKLEEHTYLDEYSYTGTHHWLDATCGCALQKDYAEHILGDDGYCSVCAAPVTDTAGIMYDTSADGTYAEVIGYEGTAKKIRIADTYNNLPVKSIYDRAFEYTNITSVIIPDSVTTIGDSAFFECDSLTSVTIPDSVTSIGDYAFYTCYSLTSVTIPDSVTSIGELAFFACTSLTSVTIGDSVSYISSSAFSCCKYTVSENMNYIGDENNPYAILVSVANKNFSTYTINQNTKYICAGAFYDCSRLSTITIPDSVTSIGYEAFSVCTSLTSVTIGNSVTSIGNNAFSGCSSLKTIYCRAESKPSGWNSNWKADCSAQVVWGYKG